MISPLPDGWYEGMPMADYLAIDALSSSGSVKLSKTPKTFDHNRKNPKEETKLMMLGTALHLAVLEPELFDDYYIVLGQCEAYKKGDGERCPNPGTYYRDGQSFCGARGHDPYDKAPMAAGIHVLNEDDMESLRLEKASIHGHDEARKFFHGQGRSEVVGIYTDPATGVRLKIRLDRDLKRIILHTDLKRTGDITDEGFQRQCGKMGWVQRSAFYRRVMAALERPAEGSIIIAAESVAPHDCRTFVLDEDNIRAFDLELDGIFATYAECTASRRWPGHPQVLTPMSLKPWHLPAGNPLDSLEEGTVVATYEGDEDDPDPIKTAIAKEQARMAELQSPPDPYQRDLDF